MFGNKPCKSHNSTRKMAQQAVRRVSVDEGDCMHYIDACNNAYNDDG